ncbi:hypothetical protein BC938DRAFT_479872, partial [Jimgerdemannia flammicorona]
MKRSPQCLPLSLSRSLWNVVPRRLVVSLKLFLERNSWLDKPGSTLQIGLSYTPCDWSRERANMRVELVGSRYLACRYKESCGMDRRAPRLYSSRLHLLLFFVLNSSHPAS